MIVSHVCIITYIHLCQCSFPSTLSNVLPNKTWHVHDVHAIVQWLELALQCCVCNHSAVSRGNIYEGLGEMHFPLCGCFMSMHFYKFAIRFITFYNNHCLPEIWNVIHNFSCVQGDYHVWDIANMQEMKYQ